MALNKYILVSEQGFNSLKPSTGLVFTEYRWCLPTSELLSKLTLNCIYKGMTHFTLNPRLFAIDNAAFSSQPPLSSVSLNLLFRLYQNHLTYCLFIMDNNVWLVRTDLYRCYHCV
ncbi:hypothetical protein PAEPH01_1916 [Pancytospora epiphaga]|nr:hypothetical protein PAEPH01_1916 [Pancytospora epiphaga]